MDRGNGSPVAEDNDAGNRRVIHDVDTMLDGKIEGSAVGTGLAAGNDFLNHRDGLHYASVSAEIEICVNRSFKPRWKL